MEKKLRLGTTIFIAVACMILSSLITYFVLNSKMVNFGKAQQEHEALLTKLFKVDDLIKDNYIGTIDDEKMLDGMLSGYVYSTGDKWAAYLDKKNFKASTQDNKGEFEGIGLKVDMDSASGNIRITNIMKNSPSSKTDLKIGDIIYKVGDEKVSSIGYHVAIQKLLGKAGTKAEFSVIRDNKEVPYSVVRAKFDVVTVEPTILYNDIAFIRITEFNENTPNEFKKEIENAVKQNPKGIIFDVRNNPGGLLDSVVSILDSLVPKGTIVTLNYKEGLLDDKGKKIEPKVYSSDEKEVALPMAVLINENTASAGELFTSTLRDFGKAKLIGEKTFGKGVGQQTFNLGDETALRLTTFTYTPPNGENYDGKGIMPDFEIALPKELENNLYTLTPENDLQLQKALTIFE